MKLRRPTCLVAATTWHHRDAVVDFAAKLRLPAIYSTNRGCHPEV